MSDKLKLPSQAMRLGATFRPQCFGKQFIDGKSCAWGAMVEALTGENECQFGAVFKRFPQLAGMSIPCPACGSLSPGSCAIVTHLNDAHHWTREQIADWLESQGL